MIACRSYELGNVPPSFAPLSYLSIIISLLTDYHSLNSRQAITMTCYSYLALFIATIMKETSQNNTTRDHLLSYV